MARKLKPSTIMFGLAGAALLFGMMRNAKADVVSTAPEPPAPVPGETPEQYTARAEAWELATGHAAPLPMAGLGAQSLYGEGHWPRSGGEWYRY